jgi:2-polyprenyl-3-methyl-5-hydroxy-6-metoxy-1,4-benzoquinol methylase
MKSELSNRYCPNCSNLDFKIIKNKNSFNISRCNNCGFVYVVNPRTDTLMENQQIKNIIPQPKKRHYQIKRLLDSYYKNKNSVSVVEIGAGNGSLAQLISKDVKYIYHGFEPSKVSAKVCQNNNLNVKNCLFNPSELGFSVQAVIVDNVLEHLYNPRQIISDAHQVLEKNGIIIVIVPNLGDIRRLHPTWGDNFWSPQEHINYFSFNHLKTMLNDYNFKVRSFGFSTIQIGSQDFLYIPKIMLDQIDIPLLGLYCYGVKQ